YDPWVDDTEVQHEYGLAPIKELQQGLYDAIVIAVAHNQFKSMSAQEFHALGKEKHVLYDLKYVLSQNESSIRL
ncbi:Vi polysaccharide biosynthesis UDP-N-acetylglucosamine C-6 dehydrogenase TviB, partial [Acinetobacter baumannii]|nr:Vi polysaccharide biosynthesis UDP-N-acetylglucosamine C-6 dehydrogenase TviB [Acinetobacter baumannii]